eukprot:524771-Hanusia_phi.AAC.1
MTRTVSDSISSRLLRSDGTSLRPYHDTVVLRVAGPCRGPAAGRRRAAGPREAHCGPFRPEFQSHR